MLCGLVSGARANCLCALSALFLGLGAIVPACAQDFRARLEGVVQDQTGARVTDATITVEGPGSQLRRHARTNNNGEFRVDDLGPALYEVTAAAEGFTPATSRVALPVSASRSIVVTLYPATVRQNVQVAAASSSITATPINSSQAVVQAAISASDLHRLPLAGRSFANIAYLAPGTAPVEPSDPTKARITAVSFGGSSGLNVECSVDGADNSDDYIGGFLQNFSPETIQEFSVRTAQLEADSGRSSGGSVVITTRSGSDQWHGEAAFYERAAALNARLPIDNPAPAPKQPFSQQNYVAAIGGAILPRRLWLFASIEQVREDASIAYSPQSLAQFQALSELASQGLIPGVGSIAVPAYTPVPFRSWNQSLRLDWAQSERSHWFWRGSGDRSSTSNDLVQQATLPSTGATAHYTYWNTVLSNSYVLSPSWIGTLTIAGSWLGHTEARNSNLGMALAFPFSSSASTISGFETFGDNQFVTPITAFPIARNQQKYQLRYDLGHTTARHSPKFGISFIHEPVLSGALSGSAEILTVFPQDPLYYLNNTQQFSQDLCTANSSQGPQCVVTAAGNGSFSQNVQRLDLYAQDSWRLTSNLTLNYGLHYSTTFGLFVASGRTQEANPAVESLRTLGIPLANGVPHDYRLAFAPRLGIVYSPGHSGNTAIRAGFGIFYNDLAQNGWVEAFQAVTAAPVGPCVSAGDPGCLPGAAEGGSGALIDPNYKTPYAIHVTAGVQHALGRHWLISADYVHEQGVHGYRRYDYIAGESLIAPDPAQQALVPDVAVFRSDNRSSYQALLLHIQGNLSPRFSLVANYALSRAMTWGCQMGELSDYVNGVCDPLHPFAPGDYGPSGEDIRHRFVIGATVSGPGGLQFSTLTQAEGARPYTIVAPDGTRAVINSVQTSLDQFRGTPYFQVDLRVSRPIRLGEGRWLTPFAEFFNLFNRSNPGANYVTNLAALHVNSVTNATAICLNPDCTQSTPITSLNQLRVPAGALGDFFGPGTTVGIPFSTQFGVRLSF